ncbi:aminotransferase class V-fold PLP-dependent enzyme [Faecalibacterium prausnitzii]|uniref:aminotransferase class V-fold PLP-dependent enzyme n=1 Tax=Faecalibacterium prausnitzii TaxID=853 RepID=UPI00291571B3|nr:aminotransferase class V-fold PLP-dependent enzyme [Faecalibacterium prausnitzii]
MIYLDNAATTLHKPPQVEQAMLDALRTAGNPGRGAHEPTLHASRLVYAARCAVAKLLNAPDPSCIAFTANATQALNTALGGLFRPGDHIITTVCEHNSVLRPLYRLRENGMSLSFTTADEKGRLQYDQWEGFLRPETRALVVTGASNVTGNGTDLARAAEFAHRHGLLLIVDAAQTAGELPLNVQVLGIDVLCFTGHKALLGPQGTGGLYVRPGLSVRPLVVGGSGVHSFDEQHPAQMPTALEAGTLNVPGLAGLCAGVEWILAQGVETLARREQALTVLFYERIRDLPNVKIYGDPEMTPRAPIVSLNIGDEDSARIVDILWEEYGICVRAGAHCAPLMHKALGTAEQGTVRFSFSHFNTEAEVLQAAAAVRELAQEA